MVREFSEEKRQEIFRLLDEIDNREWKSFMEWCGSNAEEFGDWPDKLAVSAYTSYVDEYHKKVLETNEMTRNRVNTVFENVAEINTRYAGRMKDCQVKIKEQIAMVNTMTEFMVSMTDVIPNKAHRSGGGSHSGGRENNEEGISSDQRYEEMGQLDGVMGWDTGFVTAGAATVIEVNIDRETLISEYRDKLEALEAGEEEEVINISEFTFVNQITDFIDGRSDYLDYDASMAELDCLRDRGLISEENYNCLKEIIDTISKSNDKDYDIEDLREQAREAYAEVEKKILELYIREDTLIALGWNLDMIDPRLGENYIEDMRALMLEYGLTDERSIILFLMTSTHECSWGRKMTELYDDNWFDDKSYTINTRGAGLIQVTGSNQKSFLQYVYDHSDDDNEKNILYQYIKGFENSDNPSKKNPCDNKVIINGQNVCEYIASNYAIEASLWYWCNYTEKIKIDGDWITINECIEKYGSEKELDIMFLATQCAVAGSDFHEEGTGRLFIPENPVWIENNKINVTFCRNPEVNPLTEDHDSRLPKNWDQREDIYKNSIDYFTGLLTADSLN